jgi:aspartokinase-like uncharacterized kinase
VKYDVNIIREGRGGWIFYREEDNSLPFDWDITSDGFEVYVPPPSEWDDFCKRNSATQCIGRRQQILERLAEEVRKKKAKKAKVTIDDMGIHFSFEGDWLHSLVNRILGV